MIRDKTAKAPRAKSITAHRTRMLSATAALSGVAICIIIFALSGFDIPLGETGRFVYRWSELSAIRQYRSVPLLLILPLVAAVLRLIGGSTLRRLTGMTLAVFVMTCLAAWTWWLPPKPLLQHFLNFTSPAQDGAFVLETRGHPSATSYLRDFQSRLAQSEQEMKGTRVLSNPPATAALAIALGNLISNTPTGVQHFFLQIVTNPNNAGVNRRVPDLLVYGFAAVLCAAWCVSSIFAYLLGRQFLSTGGALLFALLVTFNPATVSFTPGKDSMQLLTINAMLWLWFAGRKRKSIYLSAAAGAILIIGAIFSLVHFWIAAAAIAACIWQDIKDRRVKYTMLREVIPALYGCLAIILVTRIAIGWNIAATLFAVALRYNQIQQTIPYSRPLWFVIGLPLFLLFLGPGIWTFAILRFAKQSRGSIGMQLFLCTIAVMLLTYVMGVTYELPRLWIAFLPPLTLGVMIDRPLLHGATSTRVSKPIFFIAVVQILATAIHVDQLDPRESEFRLLSDHPYTLVVPPPGVSPHPVLIL